MTWQPPVGVLRELVAAAREDSARRKAASPHLPDVRRPGPGRFVAALSDQSPGTFPLICEVKRASPSAGALRESVDPAAWARRYVEAGARCVSVLTEGRRFGGSLEDLAHVRAAVDAPLLRKDFIVDPWMVREAAHAGADCVLLIAAAVEPPLLLELAEAAQAHGLDVLLELIYERDLDVLGLRPWNLVGVNARDLQTLQMDATRFSAFAPRIAAQGRLLVAESGVKTPEDVRRYRSEGADAALVGESLMRAEDPSALVRELSQAVPATHRGAS